MKNPNSAKIDNIKQNHTKLNFLQALYHPTQFGLYALNVLWINSDLMVLKLKLDCLFTVFDLLTRLRTVPKNNHLVCQVLQHVAIFCDIALYSQF